MHALKRNRGKFGRFQPNASPTKDKDTEMPLTAHSTSSATPLISAPLSQTTPSFPILPNPVISSTSTSIASNYNLSALDEFRKMFSGSSMNSKDVEEALKGMVQSGLVDLSQCTNEGVESGSSITNEH